MPMSRKLSLTLNILTVAVGALGLIAITCLLFGAIYQDTKTPGLCMENVGDKSSTQTSDRDPDTLPTSMPRETLVTSLTRQGFAAPTPGQNGTETAIFKLKTLLCSSTCSVTWTNADAGAAEKIYVIDQSRCLFGK
jgi:hypothetical protein